MKGDTAVIHVCEALASGILRVVPALADGTVALGIPTLVVYGRRPETPPDMSEWFDPRVRLVPVDGWGDRSPRGSLGGTMRAALALRRELSRFHRGVLHLHSTYAGLVGRVVPAPGWTRFYTPQGYAFLNDSHSRALRWTTLVAEAALARRAHTIACSRAEGAVAARLSHGHDVSVVQNGVGGDRAHRRLGALLRLRGAAALAARGDAGRAARGGERPARDPRGGRRRRNPRPRRARSCGCGTAPARRRLLAGRARGPCARPRAPALHAAGDGRADARHVRPLAGPERREQDD